MIIFSTGQWSDQELFFDTHRAQDDQDSDKMDDEDDSNDEDNWRNDYPDEDEFRYLISFICWIEIDKTPAI